MRAGRLWEVYYPHCAYHYHTLRPRHTFSCQKVLFFNRISLEFFPWGPIDKKSTPVCQRTSDTACHLIRIKGISEPTLICCLKSIFRHFVNYIYNRAYARLAPGQWEASLQSNAVSHWLCVNLESALYHLSSKTPSMSNLLGHCPCHPMYIYAHTVL